ncbi:phage tail spike protein [Priestia megaterium]|uniref:phage tail spike protein n=1 Tax=Priestia megaterium TaxID=1404 RepID=UPI0011553A13|nr:phage tail spike protein [Priestia megaterium]MED3972245.1 phage tail spike protein [Priestia megaterium]
MKSVLADGAKYLEFDVPLDHEKSSLLTIGNFIVYEDAKQQRELFRITTGIETHGESMIATIKCELAAIGDLFGKVIEDKTFTAESLEVIADFLATDTTWKIGECYYDGSISKTFDDLPRANAAILDTINDFDAEIEYKIEWDNLYPENKLINIKDKIGQKTGVTLEYERNLEGLTKTIEGNPIVTALVVRCSNKNGNGNPILLKDAQVTPPEGFEIIGNRLVDNNALEKHGNNIKHIEDSYIDGTATNPVELYNNALAQLQKINAPVVTYEASVIMLEQFDNYDHLYTEVGDTVYVKDFSGLEPILLEARVLEKEISQTDPTKGGIVLGQFVVREVLALQALEYARRKLQLREREWNIAYSKGEETAELLDEVKDNVVYKADVLSTNGSTFKNGIINTQLVAVAYKGKFDITGTLEKTAFNWKKFKADGTQDTTWIGTGIGRLVTITSDEVESRATFQCEITIDGKVVAIDQITIIDLNDAIINGERPENPTKGTMYIDSTVTPPIWYTFNGTEWEKQALSVGDLDPALLNTVTDISDALEVVDERVTTSESTIEQLSSSITSKVESTTFDDLKERVDTAESTITQQAGQINSKVAKNAVVSEINQTAETIKINVSKLDIDAITTFFAQGNPNMMPARMDSFEQLDIGTVPSSMFLGTSSLTQKNITTLYSYDGTRSLVIQSSATSDGWLYLSSGSSVYNIPVQMGASYFFSFYVYNPDVINIARIRASVKLSNGNFVSGGAKLVGGSDGWYRYELKANIPTGISTCNVVIYNDTPNVPAYFDCFQFERVDPNAIKASPFKPTSVTVINGGNITTQSIVADHIKSLNGLNVNNGALVVGANSVTIGEGTTLTAAKFAGLRGNTIYFGEKGAKIDVTTAGTIERARFGVNDSIYIAIDDNNNFNFVMDDGSFNPKFWRDSNGHRLLTLGSANIAGLASGEAVHIRNVSNSAYAKLAASDITATSSLDVWGGGAFKGDVSITSNGGLLKLNGSNQAYIEFSYGGVRKGFIGAESATGSNMTIASDKDEIIFKTDVCRVKVDNGTARVDFKNANDSAYIPIYASNITYNSVRERKKDIEPFVGTEYPDGTTKTALQQINETPIRTYRFVEELENERKHVGLILDESPVDVIDIRGEGIDAYAMGTYSWSAIQELSKENQDLRSKNADLEARLKKLEQLIS